MVITRISSSASARVGFIGLQNRGINSFDCYGVELGSVLAKHIRAQLSASRKTGASVQGFNASTSTLLEHYLANGKQKSDSAETTDNVAAPAET
jgi:hypothetical protein